MSLHSSPMSTLYCRYAFSNAGKADPIARREEEDGEDILLNKESPMTPLQFNRRLRRIAPARGDRFKGDLQDTCMVIERSKNLNLVLNTVNLVDAASGKPVTSGKGRHAIVDPSDPLRTYWLKLEPEHVARRRARGEMDDACDLSYIEKKLAYGCSASRATISKVMADLKGPLKKSGTPLTAVQEKTIAEWDAYFSPCVAKYVAAPQWPVFLLMLPPIEGNEKEDQISSIYKAKQDSGDDGTNSFCSPTVPAVPGSSDSERRTDVGGDIATAPGFSLEDSVPIMLTIIDGQLSLLKKVYVTSLEPKHFYQLPSVLSLEAFGVSVATGENTYEKRMNK